FKESEIQPAILSKQIMYTRQIQGAISEIPQSQVTELVLGKSYAVDDLIEKMIVNSDNGATYALLSAIEETYLDQVFKDLGLQNPETQGRDYKISAQEYASFFRVLYNATYLNRTESEKALSLLSRTNFKEGIVAGIPDSLTVSHKYGESIESINGLNTVELHDCGIIYE